MNDNYDLNLNTTSIETSIGENLIEIELPGGARGLKGDTGSTGPQGPQGIQGPQGEQGEQGEQGIPGQDGADGADGADGEDGVSPIITTSKSGKTTTITIVDAEGTKTATILDGEDGSSNVAWGDISGTLSNQTDLQNALDGKIPYTTVTDAMFYIWNADDGWYKLPKNTSIVYKGTTSTYSYPMTGNTNYLYISASASGDQKRYCLFNQSGILVGFTGASSGSYPSSVVLNNDIKNDLTTTNSGFVLDARQGKALKDLIDAINVPTKVSDLQNDIGFITNTVNNLTNYYTSSNTYTKTEVDQLIGAISSLKIQVVQTLPTQDIDTSTIYLVPKTASTNDNYDEYIYVSNSWEHIGSTEVDLSNYYTKTETDTLLSAKADSSSLATVATSGSYNDLSNKPTIPDELKDLSDDSTHRVVTDTEKSTWSGKQDALVSGTNIKTINNTSLLGSGNISVGGGTATDVQINGTSIVSSDVANILTNTAYDSSTNKIATMSDIPTLPTLATVATTGDYDDLTDKPTIPTVGNSKTYYGTCNTTASTAAKVVTCSGFALETGATIFVKFDEGNTYDGTATLNVNGTGAKDITRIGTTKTIQYYWTNGEVVGFTYDGTNYIMLERGTATTVYYGITKLSDSVSSTSSTKAASSKAVKTAYDEAVGRQELLVSGTNIKTINGNSILGSGDMTIGGGGTATDVQVNGTSITSGGVANLITNTAYNSSSNKIATMSDVSGKLDSSKVKTSTSSTSGDVYDVTYINTMLGNIESLLGGI